MNFEGPQRRIYHRLPRDLGPSLIFSQFNSGIQLRLAIRPSNTCSESQIIACELIEASVSCVDCILGIKRTTSCVMHALRPIEFRVCRQVFTPEFVACSWGPRVRGGRGLARPADSDRRHRRVESSFPDRRFGPRSQPIPQ